MTHRFAELMFTPHVKALQAEGLIGAIGPVMRGNQKTTRALSSLGIEVDHMIVGHWHQ